MKNFLKEVFKFALIAIFVVLPIRYFVAQPFIVSGDSMVPTFENGEYLVVDEISYRFNSPKRGDVIIMKYPLNPSKYFIKRIVGLPGETVEITGSQISIINNVGTTTLDEPYVKLPKEDYLRVTLDESEYYVMGDNRVASSDSRIWGPLPRENIVGKAIIRLLPFSRIDIKPGEIASVTIN